jgi:hypothetical protein
MLRWSFAQHAGVAKQPAAMASEICGSCATSPVKAACGVGGRDFDFRVIVFLAEAIFVEHSFLVAVD